MSFIKSLIKGTSFYYNNPNLPGADYCAFLKTYNNFFATRIAHSSSVNSLAWRVSQLAVGFVFYPLMISAAAVGCWKNKRCFAFIEAHRKPEMKLNKKLYKQAERFNAGKNTPIKVDEFFKSITQGKRTATIQERYAVNFYNTQFDKSIIGEVAKKKSALSTTYNQLSLVDGYVKACKTKLEKDNAEKIRGFTCLAEKQIFLATLQEQAIKDAYHTQLPQRIKEGFFNPEVVFDEINFHLKVDNSIPKSLQIHSRPTLNQIKMEIDTEIAAFQAKGLITKHQKDYITQFIHPLIESYQTHFKDKTAIDTFIFSRNLVRATVYQETWDKSSFSGSDHGSKHIHNNIQTAKGLHSTMEKADFTSKDEFIEHIVHIYHDIGYTVGLATSNFCCSKDHPLVGAKIIEANREYFVKYLDTDAYETIHESILYHAVVYPNLTPAETESLRGKVDRRLIRAVTSISDACATTYERKTQEFWEQPRAILALARLKFFLIQFPQYKSSIGSDQIAQDEWFGLDKTNPMDVITHDFFQEIKKELHDLVNTNSDMSDDKKVLFRQAIDQQFNAFKADVTLGQYGGVLLALESVENDKFNPETKGKEPKYLPKIKMAPSLVYGVLKDLFGKDQANKAFASLSAEFGGSVKDLENEINHMAEARLRGQHPEPKTIPIGIARFEIGNTFDVRKSHKHVRKIERHLSDVHMKLTAIHHDTQISLEKRKKIFNDFKEMCENKIDFSRFLAEVMPLIPATKHGEVNDFFTHAKSLIQEICKANEKDIEKSSHPLIMNEYWKLHRHLSFLLLSDKERAYLPEGCAAALASL